MRKLSDITLLIFLLFVMGGCVQKNLGDIAIPVDAAESDKSKTVDVTGEGEKSVDIIAMENEEEVNAMKNGRLKDEESYDFKERENGAIGSGQGIENTVIENPYFPVQEHVSLKVHTEYYGQESVDKTADAEIDRVKVYENGSIYRFTVFNTPMLGMWFFPESDVVSMYFYVTADKIYLLMHYCQLEEGGKTIYFYDDDELLVKTLDTEEKLLNYGVLDLVCQKEEMQGEFFSITQEENRIRYYYAETKPNGEQGQRELFVWEEGKGLVEFGAAYGPGPYEMYINEIHEATEHS